MLERLESEVASLKALLESDGWRLINEILRTNIYNFSLNCQQPALSLDQLIASNSAAHRLDALRHFQGLPAAKLENSQLELLELRAKIASESGADDESNEFRQKF